MAAALLNLELEQGATFTKVLTWLQEDGITPVDLTGCTARSMWKASIEDTTALLELTTENNRIRIDPTTGKITLHLTAIETAALTFTAAQYDLEIQFAETSGESYVYRLAKGKIKVSKEVTK